MRDAAASVRFSLSFMRTLRDASLSVKMSKAKKRAPGARKCEKASVCVVHQTNRRMQRFRRDILVQVRSANSGANFLKSCRRIWGLGWLVTAEAQLRGGRTI